MTRKVKSLVIEIGAGQGWRWVKGEIAMGWLLVAWSAGSVLQEMRDLRAALVRAAEKLRGGL
jgi:hypothetical protein